MTPTVAGGTDQHRLLEICLEDLGGAAVAAASGADRIEVCARLDGGGLTPDRELVLDALSCDPGPHGLGLRFLIRCRAGDFVHAPDEITLMCAQIESIRREAEAAGAVARVGFVVGTLTPAGLIDRQVLDRYAVAAEGRPLTFHKAFDEIEDQLGALDQLIDAGVERVLTSGGETTAIAGADGIRALLSRADGRIAILAGGGVRPSNVRDLLVHSGVREIHLRAQDADRRTDPDIVATMRHLIDLDTSRQRDRTGVT